MKVETWTVTICCESEVHPGKRVKIRTERLMRFADPITPWVPYPSSDDLVLVDNRPVGRDLTLDEMEALADAGSGRLRHTYRCRLCKQDQPVRGERLVPVLKRAAARGESQVLLSTFD